MFHIIRHMCEVGLLRLIPNSVDIESIFLPKLVKKSDNCLGQPIVSEEGTYPFGWLPESAQRSCDFLFNGIKSLPDRIGNLTLDPIPQALHWVQFGMQGS